MLTCVDLGSFASLISDGVKKPFSIKNQDAYFSPNNTSKPFKV